MAGRRLGAIPEVGDTPGGGRSGRSRILAAAGGGGARSVAVAVASTIAFFTILAVVIVNSPGWDEVKRTFFNWTQFRDTLPDIASAFLTNVKIFLIAEAIVLVTGLVLAVLRTLPGPAFFPIRLLAIVYTDVFRGIPIILLIFLLGFGAPALQIEGVPKSPMFWGIVALVLIYTAYVAEVYRAGIDSIHPGQDAAARSLGLSRMQSLRYVVVPQAVRRMTVPLLNDFTGLQKDSAIVGGLGVVEAFRQTQIETALTFNYTSYLVAAILFLLITIPLTRVTDWLVERDRKRVQSAAGAIG